MQPATVVTRAEVHAVENVDLSMADEAVQPATVEPEDCGVVVNVVPPRKQLNIAEELVAAVCHQFPEHVTPVPDV